MSSTWKTPTSPTTVRDIPITIVGQEELTDRGLMVIQLSEDSVDLRISGRKKDVDELKPQNITLNWTCPPSPRKGSTP